jgi:hypothetical protein
MLPSKQDLEYIKFTAEMISESALITPDLRGDLKGWEQNRPLPQNHRAADDCPCGYCEQNRKIKRVVVANTVAKMLRGREMGIPPLRGLEVQPIIRGKMGLSYQEMIRQLSERGWEIDWKNSVSTKTECSLIFRKGSEEATFSFTMADAIQAGYATRKNSDGSPNFYDRIPEIMLLSRTTSQGYNRLTGMKVYTKEELNDFEPEQEPRTVESIEHKAGVDQPAPDETLIPPELESSLRDAAHQAGKQQAWAAAKLAEIQGKIKAAWIADTEATPEERNEWAAEMVKVAIEELQREQEAKPAKVLRVKKPTATEQAAAPPPPPVAEQQVEAPAPAPPEKEEEGFPSLW